MPTCALSTAGKAAIDAAAAGSLNVGQFKIGSTAGNVLTALSTNISGDLTHTGAGADIRWASFGANKLNLYIRLFGTTEIVIGNMIIFLSDNTTPLAYMTFDQKLVKRANIANKAQDSIVFVVSMRRTGISGKFAIDIEQSQNFALPVHATREDFEASRDPVGIISTLAETNRAAVGLKVENELWVNPMLDIAASGDEVVRVSGGTVGDLYA